MTGFSTYYQTAIDNWVKGTTFPAAPANLYVALFSADPTDAGVLTNEVTTTVRTAGRVAVPSSGWSAITTTSGTSAITNSAIVEFGAAAGAATVTFFGLFDAATAGNMIGSGSISGGTIASANEVNFAIGALTFSAS